MHKNIVLALVFASFTVTTIFSEARYTRSHVRPSTGKWVTGYFGR